MTKFKKVTKFSFFPKTNVPSLENEGSIIIGFAFQ